MAKVRLRTKLVLSLIFTTAVLTGGSLLIVQGYLRNHARAEIVEQIPSAMEAFGKYVEQRQRLLLATASVSADLPTVRALMTTKHEGTIQDGSADFWR